MTSYNNIFAGLLSRLSDAMARSGEPMKARAYKKAEETILGFTGEIKSVEDIKGKPAIGQAVLSKLQEYINTGKIRILEAEENKPERVLTDVYGIGPKKAKELVEQGITDIDTLRERQDELLNEVQKKGLIYYEDILKRIPRSEIEEYNRGLKKMVPKGSHYEIVGSYRRGLETSGDIDIIMTSSDPHLFDVFLDKLIHEKIIVEVLSRGRNKCLVVAKSPKSDTFRRVDFLYATPAEYPFSILYFTGSKGFNAVMRGHALTMGYSLNEHGFTVIKDNPNRKPLGNLRTEKDIFDFLELEYKTPQERVDGRAVIPLAKSPQMTSSPLALEVAEPVVKEKKTRKKREPNKPRSILTISAPIELEGSEIIPEPIVKEKKTRKKREPIKLKSKEHLESEPIEPIMPAKNKEKKKEQTDIKSTHPHIDMISETVHQFKQNGLPAIESLSKEKLSEIIKYANDAYYNENPVLSDNEYDIIKEFLEKRFPEAEVLQEVGAPILGKTNVALPF